jgi:hypothetical protein
MFVGDVASVGSILEASRFVQVVPFKRNYLDNPNENFDLWRIKNVSKEKIENAMLSVYWQYSGRVYGVLQIIWFIWRWAHELFGIDIRRERAWFPGGQICSELLWHYLYRLDVPEIKSHIVEWSSDSVNVQDFAELFQKLPEYFEKVESRWAP